MINFRLSPEMLKEIININKDIVIETISSPNLEPEKIKILKAKYLDKLFDSIDTKRKTFILVLSKESLNSIVYDLPFSDFKSKVLNEVCKGYNKLVLSNTLDIISANSTTYSSTPEAISAYKDLSYDNFVFFFGDKLETFVNGNMDHLNTFYCDADLQRYKEKFTIEQLQEVLDLYANTYLVRQDEYSRFFENKGILDKLPDNNNYYILRNKPEKFMRDHLRYFLNENMQARFQIEVELPKSKRELDLSTEVNGKFYFIEIKWLGKSINDISTDISKTVYGDNRARQGVKQTLEYIEELTKSTTNNVQCGHLVIFDARLIKTSIDYKNYNFLDDNLKSYLDYLNIYDKLYLNNTHPC